MWNTTITDNLIVHCNQGRPVQLLDGIRGLVFANNTVTDGGGDGISLTLGTGSLGSSGIQIWNNVFDSSYYNNNSGQVSFFDTNWYRVQARSGMSGTNAFTGDPKFANSTTYSLQSGSPLLGKGLTRSGTPSTDVNGNTRPSPPALSAQD
jgi:hypothetical protein